MAINAQIWHEDGTPLTDAENQYWFNGGTGCPDCDRLSAPELARRAEQKAAVEAAHLAELEVTVRKRSVVVSNEEIAVTQECSESPKGMVRKRPDALSRAATFVNGDVPFPCPKHVPRPHPWISAIQLADVDIEVLEGFVSADEALWAKGWVPYLAAPSNRQNGFVYQDRAFSHEEIHAEIERRKGQPARVENAMQKYQRLSRVPHNWITDAERSFLRSREAAIAAMKLRMR